MEKCGIQKFNCNGDLTNVGPQWTRWLSRFEIFADSKGPIVVAHKADNKHGHNDYSNHKRQKRFDH